MIFVEKVIHIAATSDRKRVTKMNASYDMKDEILESKSEQGFSTNNSAKSGVMSEKSKIGFSCIRSCGEYPLKRSKPALKLLAELSEGESEILDALFSIGSVKTVGAKTRGWRISSKTKFGRRSILGEPRGERERLSSEFPHELGGESGRMASESEAKGGRVCRFGWCC